MPATKGRQVGRKLAVFLIAQTHVPTRYKRQQAEPHMQTGQRTSGPPSSRRRSSERDSLGSEATAFLEAGGARGGACCPVSSMIWKAHNKGEAGSKECGYHSCSL